MNTYQLSQLYYALTLRRTDLITIRANMKILIAIEYRHRVLKVSSEKCPHCTKSIVPTYKYCPYCGSQLGHRYRKQYISKLNVFRDIEKEFPVTNKAIEKACSSFNKLIKLEMPAKNVNYICNTCHKIITNNYAYCPHCGQRLSTR